MRITLSIIQSIFLIQSIAIIFCTAGCKRDKEARFLLIKARDLADNDPVEALKFIDSIKSPQRNLTKEDYMNYLVTHTQIYYINYLPIEKDSLIFLAVEYYQNEQRNFKQTALACYYAGAVLRSQKKLDQAMEYFLEAENYAKRSTSQTVLGLINFNIADLLAEQGRYSSALNRYGYAARYYKQHPEKLASSLSSMGRMYLLERNADSAFHFFHRGLEIANNIGNKKLQRQLAESLSVAYEQIERYPEALKYLHQSLAFNTDSSKMTRYYLNFALLYNKGALHDSTTYYAERLKEELNVIKDNYLRASILSFLIDFEKEQQHISLAFQYQTERMNVLLQIMKEREKQSIYKIEKRYNYEQIEKRYFETLSIKQWWIIALLSTIILGGILFFIYRTKQKNKQLAIQIKIETLTEMNHDLETTVQKKQQDLRRELLWRFDITKKFIKINKEINKKAKTSSESGLLLKQFNTIVYGQSSLEEQWKTLHQAFCQARPGYSEKIKKFHPEITETEFRICILTYADFSVKEIALILDQSPNTVQTRRTSLRKKLGVPNGGDIADSIDRLFG